MVELSFWKGRVPTVSMRALRTRMFAAKAYEAFFSGLKWLFSISFKLALFNHLHSYTGTIDIFYAKGLKNVFNNVNYHQKYKNILNFFNILMF